MAELCIAAGAGKTLINGGSHWVAASRRHRGDPVYRAPPDV
jgi:hypothetical protein